MPVTARLSQKFYERLGDDIANELVEWFNAVDATYRFDLRELNELNFARFDAKLDQRVAQLDAKLDQRIAQLDAKLDQRIAQLDAKLDQRVAELRSEITAGLATLKGELTAEIARAQSATVKWMFGFWAPTAIAIIGTALGVVALLLRG